jgi:hypothetical protein
MAWEGEDHGEYKKAHRKKTDHALLSENSGGEKSAVSGQMPRWRRFLMGVYFEAPPEILFSPRLRAFAKDYHLRLFQN